MNTLDRLCEQIEANFVNDSEILTESSYFENSIEELLDENENITMPSMMNASELDGFDKIFTLENTLVYTLNNSSFLVEASDVLRLADNYNRGVVSILDELCVINNIESDNLYVYLESGELRKLQDRIRKWTARLRKTVRPDRRAHFQQKLNDLKKQFLDLLNQQRYKIVK